MNIINELQKDIGRPYEMFWDDNNYQGCFYPIYKAFPHLKKYPLPSENHEYNYKYGIALIENHFVEVDKNNIKSLDMIATRFNDELHVALYIGNDQFYHVFRGHNLQIGRLKMFKKYKVYRVIQ